MKKKQLLLNIGANILQVLVTLAVSFFLTPYIVKNIGEDAYSFVPISNNFTSYMAILTIAMTSMSARFVTLRIHDNDIEGANNYYSTAFFSNFLMASICSIVFIFVIIFLNQLINIPVSIFTDIRLLFILIFITFIMNVATNSYYIAAFSMNRLDITSVISIAATLVRIVIIIVLFKFFPAKVYYIGLSIFAMNFIIDFMNMITAKRIMPSLKIAYKNIKIKLVKELFFSGIWNSFSQLSNVLLTGLDLVIANILLGAQAAGILAVAKTAPMALQSLTNVIPHAFNPYLTILYAKGDRENFTNELLYTLKFTAIVTGIPIAGFMVLSAQFFRLWVPTVASNELTLLAILTMVSMIASFCITPLFYTFTITNKLKWPAFAIFFAGIANILLVMGLLKFTSLGLYAIAGVSSVLEVFRCLIFAPIYAARSLGEKNYFFYKSIGKSLIYMVVLLSVYFGISQLFPANSWKNLLVDSVIMAIVGLLVGYVFVLDSQEKKKINMMIIKVISKLNLRSNS